MEIQDFGEKIGGAKKDLWKERGLSVDDLLEMNDAEKNKLIKKDNVWKKPDYQAMLDKGLSKRVIYFIKTIRDATPTKPVLTIFDKSNDIIQEKQEGYITFVSQLRDYVMNIKTEDEVLNFYNDFMKNYIIKKDYSYYVEISPTAFGCIDNKLLKASQVHDFRFIDREISKKEFLYTDDEKILSRFDIILFDNANVKFIKDYTGRDIIQIQNDYSKTFLYPKDELNNPESWKENTFFIYQHGNIIKNNLESIDEAEKYLLDNYKIKSESKTNAKTRKKGFIPEQLKHISRTGEDYRNNKNITGKDMMKTFNFRGGEFGNWLNENDRQQSLNYGYDALLDLSKALSISPTDISLGNRLSIAFGSRGSGNALAHYEPDREVINLTKMKGAGSLAHEWGHALDDIMGKQLGEKGFLTENYNYSKSYSNIIKDIIETMQYKTVCNEETMKNQFKQYEQQITKLRNNINTFFPEEHLSQEQLNLKDKLIDNIIHNAVKSSETFIEYIQSGSGNDDIDKLSNLRKETVGRVISKEDRINIARLQDRISYYKKQVGLPQKVRTDFYNNSIQFDDLYSKTDHGYWQSKVEMFARSFACYVVDKLNNRNDYLCGHAESSVGFGVDKNDELTVIKAYPEGEERIEINKKIDKLIEFLKEKQLLHNYDFDKTNDNFEELDYA